VFCLLLAPYSLLNTPGGIAAAQKLAFLTPEKTQRSQIVNEKLQSMLAKDFKILDDSMVETVSQSLSEMNVFNLSREEARNLGAAIGCDYFIVQKADTLRRASLSKPTAYYESYAVVYLVSSRTGRLLFWNLSKFEADASPEAERKMLAATDDLAAEISSRLKASKQIAEIEQAGFAELPGEDSPESKKFRPPLPYRRFKPQYTDAANLYNVAATVDAAVDIDENGKVLRIEILRWAGYGLDESVAETIRKMQWQPALREGKALPIRVLLRYNFKKLESRE
jgi:TonB family protein